MTLVGADDLISNIVRRTETLRGRLESGGVVIVSSSMRESSGGQTPGMWKFRIAKIGVPTSYRSRLREIILSSEVALETR